MLAQFFDGAHLKRPRRVLYDGIRVWLNIFANGHITHGICNIIALLQKLDIIVINGGAAIATDSGNAEIPFMWDLHAS
jgi:hypothetical protein